jgi:tryptophan synthase alpha subunit
MKKWDFPIENFQKFRKTLGLDPSSDKQNLFFPLILLTLSNIVTKKKFRKHKQLLKKLGRNGFIVM